jgi:glycerol-3-phosphate O-acyltransferase / dihydroxyacetone phosphate acyltransferase
MAIAYCLVRTLARWVLEVFYRRIEVVGIEHLPESGPLIVTANHQNALVDPMLLLGLVPRRMVPVAKAPLFRHPVIGPFLRIVGALPVLRRQEGNVDPTRNRETFAAASARLGAGHAVLIFPEGTSQPEPTLMPLRTGAARMLLEAEATRDGMLGVALVPIGLVYHEPGTFRAGRALLSIGERVTTEDCVALYDRDPEGAAHRLTDRLSAALRRQIVEADDRETLRLLRALESIAHAGVPSDARAATARTAWMQGAMRAYRHFRETEPARVARFRADVERYLADLERTGLSDRGLAQPYSAGDVLRYALRAGISLLLALPLAAWGLASHVLPYTLTSLILRRIKPEPDEEATYKIIGSVVIYPLCWLAEGWLAWKLGREPLLALFAVLLVPTGFFTIAWRDRLERVGRDARGFFRLLIERDLRGRLGARRQALLDELDALAGRVPDSVRAALPDGRA